MGKLKRIQVTEETYQSIVDLAKSHGLIFKTDKEIVETFIRDDFFKIVDSLTKKVDALEKELKSETLISIDSESLVRIEKLKAIEVLPKKQEEFISTLIKSYVESNADAIEAAIKKI